MKNMDTKQATMIARDAAEKQYGEAFSEDVFKKAMEKTKRWLRAAHGGLEWDELNDVWTTVEFYYQETLEDKSGGKDTFNMQTMGIGQRCILKPLKKRNIKI